MIDSNETIMYEEGYDSGYASGYDQGYEDGLRNKIELLRVQPGDLIVLYYDENECDPEDVQEHLEAIGQIYGEHNPIYALPEGALRIAKEKRELNELSD